MITRFAPLIRYHNRKDLKKSSNNFEAYRSIQMIDQAWLGTAKRKAIATFIRTAGRLESEKQKMEIWSDDIWSTSWYTKRIVLADEQPTNETRLKTLDAGEKAQIGGFEPLSDKRSTADLFPGVFWSIFCHSSSLPSSQTERSQKRSILVVLVVLVGLTTFTATARLADKGLYRRR
jgi:hypothetical protein